MLLMGFVHDEVTIYFICSEDVRSASATRTCARSCPRWTILTGYSDNTIWTFFVRRRPG